MRRVQSISILILSVGLTPFVVNGGPSSSTTTPRRAPADYLKSLDNALDELAPTLDAYPPQVQNDAELRAVERRWMSAATVFEKAVRDYPQDAQVLWRAGELYRMGHNLDRADAWKKSERYCKAAIAVDPKCVQGHLTLGTLYVNTDPRFASAAEEEFKAVIDLGDAASLPGALSGLVFAYYYQAKFRDAVTQAEAFLRLRPDNEGMKEIKAIAEEQARKAGQ